MSRIAKRMTSRLHREKGAATIVVAIFLPIVLVGLLALTVDYGSMMYERRQLQNAADASALAFARICAKSTAAANLCDPSSSNTSTVLAPLLSGNSADRLTQLNTTLQMPYGICGRATGGSNIVDCPSASSNASIKDLAQCPPLPPWLTSGAGASAAYVEVYTKTLVRSGVSSGPSVLPSFFSQALPGNPGTQVSETTCSRAAWGGVGSTQPTMPLVIGLCNWNDATSGGTSFAAAPPYSPAPSTSAPPSVPGTLQPFITTIFGQVNGSETAALAAKTCHQDLDHQPSSGAYTPGGFGWVQTCADLGAAAPPACVGAPPCTAVFSDTGTVGASPGGNPATGCTNDLLKGYVGTQVFVPVITWVQGTGNNAIYTVQGISSFFLAGYKNLNAAVTDRNGYDGTDAAYRSKTCDPGTPTGPSAQAWKSTCLWGWFTSPILPIGTPGSAGGANRGPVIIADAG